jgi:hypothetical protein
MNIPYGEVVAGVITLGVLAIAIPLFYIIILSIPGPLPVSQIPNPPPETPFQLWHIIWIVFGAGVVIDIIFFVMSRSPSESNFATFWESVETKS